MAQRINVILEDDLTGESADGVTTTSFGFDGVDYVIDLSPENRSRLESALEEFIAHARRDETRGKRKPKTSTGSSESAAIRAWCREQGIEVGPRGRIPAEIIQRYRDAH